MLVLMERNIVNNALAGRDNAMTDECTARSLGQVMRRLRSTIRVTL